MIDKKIKELYFCMENLEYFIVPISEVFYFEFINVHKNMSLIQNKLLISIYCDEALFILKQSANEKALSSFDLKKENLGLSELSFFGRLQGACDCVGIDIIFEEEAVEIDKGKQLFKKPPDLLEILVPWKDGKDEYTNKLQRTMIQSNEYKVGYGGLLVHFGKTTNLLDAFNEV